MNDKRHFSIFHLIATSLIFFACSMLSLSSFAAQVFSDAVYVSLRESNQIAKFPGSTIWQGGPKMLYDALTSDGKTLVVSSPKDGGIYLYETATGRQLGMVKTGKAAKGVKISPDDKLVLVSNEDAASVSVVDLKTQKRLTDIAVPNMPHNVRFTQNGNTAYVTLQGGAGLGVIDVKSHKLKKVIKTPGIDTPHNLDLSKDEKLAFIRDTANHVGVLDIAAEKIVKILEVGQGHAGIDVTPNGRWAFTGAIADDVVSVIDTQTLEVVKKIKVGFGPHGVRASLDNRYLYVAVTADDKLEVIDIDKLSLVDSIKLESFPFWVAVKGNP